MSTYFELRNANNIVSIDDKYRYFHELNILALSNGANNPRVASSYNDEYDNKRRFSILRFDSVDCWMYPPANFLNYSTYPRYIAYIAEVNKNRLYGIRFKKRSSSPKVFVRLSQTPIGTAITKNKNRGYLFVEVVCTDNSTPINSVNAYRDYYEVVEIGDSENDKPSGSGYSGIEIYNANSEVVWKSSYKMVNVESFYSGNLAGKYSYPSFTTNHIVVPNRSYKRSDLHFFDDGFAHRGFQYKDFFSFTDAGLINTELTIAGEYGNQYIDHRGAVWDGRDFGTDTVSNKLISGLILR